MCDLQRSNRRNSFEIDRRVVLHCSTTLCKVDPQPLADKALRFQCVRFLSKTYFTPFPLNRSHLLRSVGLGFVTMPIPTYSDAAKRGINAGYIFSKWLGKCTIGRAVSSKRISGHEIVSYYSIRCLSERDGAYWLSRFRSATIMTRMSFAF
jgi:hypothetical protein